MLIKPLKVIILAIVYNSKNNARDAIFVLLGLSAITAVAVAASQSSKKEKEDLLV